MYIAITSINTRRGSKIPAACIGFITKDITGTASIEIGPANPPFPIPKTATPKAAKKKN